MGACSADYDNDGWADLYITSVGPNRLYRNTGNGRFEDVTASAGVGFGDWSVSCAFADVDNDGHLDLYVVNYLDFDPGNNKYCGTAALDVRTYCAPSVYNAVSDVLYRNRGDGTFSDASRQVRIDNTAGKGLGVVFSDYDADGWVDMYVANDSVANFLYRNRGGGVFDEVGLLAGVAVGPGGRPQGGMGADMADADGDQRMDVFVTNLDREMHSLYRQLDGGLFEDATSRSNLGLATLPFVGFGTAFLDFDNDSDLDLAIANGHVFDNVAYFRGAAGHAQQNLLFENDGNGNFVEVGRSSGSGFAVEKVSRALAVGDMDNDGDLDILVGNNGQAPDLLLNNGGNRKNSLLIRTVGSTANRDGVGARLRLKIGDKVLVREVKAGSSYASQNDLRVHFGLAGASTAERLEIAWPGGHIDVLEDIGGNQMITVLQGGRILSAKPFQRGR